jgi:cell wall-associated NlpC family hydrolase
MVAITDIRLGQEYGCNVDIDLYKSPQGSGLVTQAKAGRHLQVIDVVAEGNTIAALQVRLCEDDYPGWVPAPVAQYLSPVAGAYRPPNPTPEAIAAQLERVIHFTQAAMRRPNVYLWGGTIGPNFDCSGLMQAAFATAGVILPRDSYQQEHFVESIHLSEVNPGDLLFFGTRDRATHVALYLADGNYIHSSGKDQGRNGIGIDSIIHLEDPVSHTYYQQLRGAGRVTRSYQPTGEPMLCYS